MIIYYRWLLLAITGLALLEPSETADVNCTDNRIINGPHITPCVSEITLQKGQNYTLTCKGVSKLRFIQQHVSEVVTSNFTIINISSSIDEGEYRFQRTLHLYEVDQFAIGYYACSDESVDESTVNNLIEEPENTEHVSYIYVYVNGTGSIFAPMSQIIRSRCNKILIECRPSTPDVEVKLTSLHNQKSQNKTPKYSSKIGFVLKKCDNFAYICKGQRGNLNESKGIRNVRDPLTPEINALKTATERRFAKGENFTLTCKVNTTFEPAQIVNLGWELPNGLSTRDENINATSNEINSTDIFSILTVYNASEKHGGKYRCVSSNPCKKTYSNEVQKEYIAASFLNLTIKNKGNLSRQKHASISVELNAYPEAVLEVLKNDIKLPIDNKKYEFTKTEISNSVQLRINNLTVKDIGNYTLIARNDKHTKNVTYELGVADDPKVRLDKNNMKCVKGTVTSFRCDVSGYPLPTIKWEFLHDTYVEELKSIREDISSQYNKTAFLDIKNCHKEGNISCIAIEEKRKKNDSATRELFVYEIYNGFGIFNKKEIEHNWFLEDDSFSVKCLASKHDFTHVTWEIENSGDIDIYSKSTEFSLVAELNINKISLNHIGTYKCVGTKLDENKVDDFVQINVLKLQPPTIYDQVDVEEDVFRFDNKYLNCTVKGAPLPQIEWYKDGKLINANYDNVKVYQNTLNPTTINATIVIEKMQPNNTGKWECVAKGRSSIQKKSFTLNLKVEKETKRFVHYGIAIAVIMLILIILIVYLTVKIRKEKQFRKELAAAGLLYFKEGVINSLNPDLGIDEQAELLPYDEKFEYPRDSLKLGIQLGAGAFGIVYKAEARGIIDAEETTTVAVKTVKKTADNMYIKALASELKIMVHLGKHINIVNLLGACTKNVGKRELYVIVEYCKYGNIHNYMQRHRDVFIDQLETGNKDKLGKVNRAYTTTSTGSTGMNSEYFGANNTQDTDHTFVNTENTSVRKNSPNTRPMEEVKASEGYMQPEWRSNYVSDYSYDGRSPRPLSSRDLLAWAFQIARGMEYLASRKVLHGDLAARNILLADDNVVKICDFGLAKSIYKNDEYQTKANCLLPVKWLAIECMTDRIFSTQSDVWSFGIVLWEMFSLAKTPYPNIHPSSLLQFLSEGHRLDKPAYADERLYDVMKKCWEAKPPLRPSFSQLQELLGTFLEDNVRNHYVDLNNTCLEKNEKVGTQEDYLDMMCAPDYNNLVTPSPHHIYINADAQKSFFPPTPVKVDDEGYLQMSPTNPGIFSPRNPNSEFDFDPRKFNAKTSDAGSCGSELTPMLTLNNLPARSGSESDHEGNAPYLNVCTPIDEADEVFAPSLNETKNAKNMQQSAVTNPTYITFENLEEKPKDIINYVNMPNGLVK